MEVDNSRLTIKRKDIDRVNDDFSDFSLHSPARKIRRLDVELPPIIEEEEVDMPMVTEELEPTPVNEERAIVLFKPLGSHPPCVGNLFVDRDLISGFKKRFINDNKNEEKTTSNKCKAVVCWNPPVTPYSQQSRVVEITELDETGEDAVMDEADMEIEEEDSRGVQQEKQQEEQNAYGFGLHQWQQQQNFMNPWPSPQVGTSPVTWLR